jgi:hypothetical protein
VALAAAEGVAEDSLIHIHQTQDQLILAAAVVVVLIPVTMVRQAAPAL